MWFSANDVTTDYYVIAIINNRQIYNEYVYIRLLTYSTLLSSTYTDLPIVPLHMAESEPELAGHWWKSPLKITRHYGVNNTSNYPI